MQSIFRILRSDQKHQQWLSVGFIVIVGISIFVPVFDFQFLSDDWDLIYHADRYDSFFDRFILNDHQGAEGYSYRPFVGIYLTVLKSLFSLDPTGYHVFFVFIHILNAVLVYFLTKRIVQDRRGWYWITFTASLLFLILPAHGEAVFWISAGADVVATSFYLLSVLCFLTYLSSCHPGFNSGSRNENKQTKFGMTKVCYALSLLFFLLGLLTKEIVITLPIILMVLHWHHFVHNKKRYVTEWRDRPIPRRIFLGTWYTFVPLIIIVGVYLALRWNATGVLVGYYGRSSIGINFESLIRMASDMLSSFFAWGNVRLRLSEIFKTQFHWLIVLFAFIVLYIKRHCEERSDEAISGHAHCNEIAVLPSVARDDRGGNFINTFLLLLSFFVISVLPVLLLGFDPLSDEGERYGYLPSVFFVILFVFILYLLIVIPAKAGIKKQTQRAKKLFWFSGFHIKARNEKGGKKLSPEHVKSRRFNYVVYVVISLIFTIYFGYGLRQKINFWQTYQDTNYQILNQLYQLNDPPRVDAGEAGGRKIVLAGLPDSYKGVQGFRNGIEEAYRMYYGENIEIVRIPVYTVDNSQINFQFSIFNFQSKSNSEVDYTSADGFSESTQNQLFLKTKDKSLRLTGEKEYEDEYVGVEFFRWHYDINRSDGVTIRLKEKLLEDVQIGNVSVVLFDGVKLVRVL